MTSSKWKSRTRQDLIIEVWEALDCESVGERELLAIMEELTETLGAGGVISPAMIARELADEGAILRHPEVLRCDTRWREQQLTELFAAGELDFGSLDAAAASLRTVEKLRALAQEKQDQTTLRRLQDLMLHFRQREEFIGRSRIVSTSERAVAKEVANWLAVWLEQPQLFSDWLELRQGSAEYQHKFASLLGSRASRPQ
jgi:hypothetical protein